MGGADPHHLARFLSAQEAVYAGALAELAAGRKRSHWMWFVFPQLAGLGRSETAAYYGIAGLAEARAYLAHPVLGARLLECTAAVNRLAGHSALDIFGAPDDLKFCSCMTLFERAAGPDSLFAAALDRYCGGRRDPLTLGMLGDGD
mgnify:CR=1 FL=1